MKRSKPKSRSERPDERVRSRRCGRGIVVEGGAAEAVHLGGDLLAGTACERCGFFETGPQFVEIIQRQRDHAANNDQHDRAQLYAQLLTDIDNTS